MSIIRYRGAGMPKASIAALVCLLGVSNAVAAPAPDDDPAARLQRIQADVLPATVPKVNTRTPTPLAARMKDLKVPGVSMAMIHDGKIEWARGFGTLSVAGLPVTPGTLFQAGSISKSVTALAVLRLVQAGKLDLDVNVNSYLKGWKVPDSRFTSEGGLTLRELLSHTAGVTVHGFEGYESGARVPTTLQILNGAPPANSPAITVDTEPGTAWRYSGGGYVIVQKVLEDVTGEPFARFMKEQVLAPLGMSQSSFAQPLPREWKRNAAEPYDENGKRYPGGAHTYPEMAAAGLWTTPSDLARFLLAIQDCVAGKPDSILSQYLAQEMIRRGGLGHWGLGIELGGSDSRPFFQHGGVDAGFVSFVIAYDQGDGLVIMTNGMNGGAINNEVLRAVAREYNWPDYQPKIAAETVTSSTGPH